MNPTPTKGDRTLVSTLDHYANHHADKVFAAIPRSSDLSQGFRDVTYRDISRAVDAAAYWLKERHGISNTFETLMYMGINDLRYAVFFYASIKCGYKSIFLSSRNPTAHNVMLLQHTECTKCFIAEEFTPVVENIKTAYPQLETSVYDEWTTWLERYSTPFPFEKSYEEAELDPVLVLHSSGSTGPPKPITLNNQYFTAVDAPFPSVPGREVGGLHYFDFEHGGFFYGPFPAFHLSGFLCMCVYPVFAMSASSVLGPPDKPPSAPLVKEIIDAKQVKLLYTPPSIVEQIAQLPGGMETLSRLETLSFVGGPLSPSCGDELSKTVNVCQFYGSTEAGGAPLLRPLPEDWQYMEFHPCIDVTMEPAVDGASEFIYKPNPKANKYRGSAATFPELEEFRSKDLFMPHPTKPGLWRFYGRTDDIIVLSNSEKYNPVPAEKDILGHPGVSGILIFGEGRKQCAALVEARDEKVSKDELLNQIWPAIEKSNEKVPTIGRLVKSKVAVVDSLVRAPKGSVVRKLSLEAHSALANSLYDESRRSDSGSDYPKLEPYDLKGAVATLIKRCCLQFDCLTGIKDGDNFYIRGLDSLLTSELTRAIRRGLESQYSSDKLAWLDDQVIYQNSSIAALTSAVHAGLLGTSPKVDHANYANTMSSMVAAYESRIRELSEPQASPCDGVDIRTILLTGGSGSLGSQILRCSLGDARISKAYCLGRSTSSSARTKALLQSECGPQRPEKCEFLTCRLDQADLGLSPEKYSEICKTVDTIIHLAWEVNFNTSLSTFEPVHIEGVFNLIRLCTNSARKPRLVFASSISSVDDLLEGEVPEALVSDAQAAKKMGYAQSKQVAERILSFAAHEKGVRSDVLRIGQIAGPVLETKGPSIVWNVKEWFPSLVITSKAIQKLPGWLPAIDWIPSDLCARWCSGLALDNLRYDGFDETCNIFNVVNPYPVPWTDLFDVVRNRLGPSCQIVPFEEWLDAVEAASKQQVESVAAINLPALRLLPFWRDLAEKAKLARSGWTQPPIRMERATASLKDLPGLKAVSPGWMEQWLDQWNLLYLAEKNTLDLSFVTTLNPSLQSLKLATVVETRPMA